ncbi:carbohydrate-binding module family 20 domain-containing protein [Streptacidiphilus anmyonensis]|uniref:carbohydrate-binding module family 20 domain-containing protein n=1 Tax=Streptacidiphilus anmyonensis TaxID=405782 RepID=UPI0007C70162|nr:carbohydrate-binding module family 20 domain-containing protein [Streptacidiphilus anmyonensis]
MPRQSTRWRALLASSALLAAGTLVPLTLASGTAHASAPNGGDVIANLFMWNWPSVASECRDVLGPKGYGAVQVAPPQDSIRLSGSHPWWEIYQPVGYDLNSRMGTEAQFQSMVTACHNAGVKVYADAVINHMSGTDQTSTDSYGGDSFNVSSRSYGEVPYTSADFHTSPANCPNADLSIQDWNSQTQVQECDLENLADLYTETDDVRSKIAGYLNKLIGYGVDGFRVDSAKHINQADMANIESRLNNTQWGARPYVLQEVYPGSSGNLAPSAFESDGSVIGFDYADNLKNQFTGSIANLRTFGQSWGLEPSASDGAMVANHDTERNGSTLSYKNGAVFTLANEFMLAWGYGTQPSVYSGFTWNSTDDSPPADGNGYVTATDCSNGWYCTDRIQGVANMVGWHNAAQGAAVANWYDDGSNLIAFSRGDKAWITINNENTTQTRTFQTGLPAGTYCDVIHGDYTASTGACSGPTVAVDANGDATVSVAAKDAVALYALTTSTTTPSPTPSASATPSASPTPTSTPTSTSTSTSAPSAGTVAETFTVSGAPTSAPMYLVGSVSGLGGWAPASALPMTQSGATWTVTVDLPQTTAIQYKYIEKDSSGNVTWEPGANHSATTGSGATAALTDGYNGSVAAVSETFDVNATTWYGQNLYVVGSLPALGDWNTANAVPLSSAAYPVWSAAVALPADTAFQYKYVKKDPDGTIEWESGANRGATTGTTAATLGDAWNTPATSPVGVSFDETKSTVPGQNVYVVGSIAALGFWDPTKAVPLSSANYPVWATTLSITPNTNFQYKYIVIDAAGNVTWESGANRTCTTGSSGSVTLDDSWK